MNTSDEELLDEVDGVLIPETQISPSTFATQLNNKLGLNNSQQKREAEAAILNTKNNCKILII